MNLIYLDDNIDPFLEKYLSDFCKENKIIYEAWNFEYENTKFIDVINDKRITNANILVVDSILFEGSTGDQNRFTGEELYLIMKKIYPYVEVIVISSPDKENEINRFVLRKKYSPKRDCSDKNAESKVFYEDEIGIRLQEMIIYFNAWNVIKEKVTRSSAFDQVLIEKINSTFTGDIDYDNLKKNDIDEFIKLIKEVL